MADSPFVKFIMTSLIALFAWGYLYAETLSHMVTVWSHSETYKHCFFILPISLYLIYEKRNILSQQRYKPTFALLLPLAVVQAIYILSLQLSIQLIAHFCAVLSLVLIIWTHVGHKAFREMLFPIFYLFFCVPFGEEFVPELQIITADISKALLVLVGIPVYRDGLYLYLPNGTFHVAEACAGIRFLIGTFALGVLLAYMNYQTLWKRMIYIFICAIVPIIANGIRAFGIMVIGYLTEMKHAVGADHLVYGWFFFLFVLVLLFLLGNIGSEIPARQSKREVPIIVEPRYKVLFSLTNLLIITLAVISLLNRSLQVEVLSLSNHIKNNYSTAEQVEVEWAQPPPDQTQTYWVGTINDVPTSIVYRTDSEGDELVSSLNRAFNPDVFSLSDREHVAFQGAHYQLITIGNVYGESKKLLVWYQLEDVAGSEPLNIKWHQFLSRLAGRRADGYYIVSEVPSEFTPASIIQKFKPFSLPELRRSEGM